MCHPQPRAVKLAACARRGSPDPVETADRRSPPVRRGSPDPAETTDRRSPPAPGRPSVESVVRSETAPQPVETAPRFHNRLAAYPLGSNVAHEPLPDFTEADFFKYLRRHDAVATRIERGDLPRPLLAEFHRKLGATPRFVEQAGAVLAAIDPDRMMLVFEWLMESVFVMV